MPLLHTRHVIHKFHRMVSYNVSLWETTGWSASSLSDIEFTFSLASTFVYIGGVLSITVSNPGASELSALYQKWRISEVEASIIFSNNTSNISGPSTTLPLINLVVNYDDITALTLSQIQQFDDLMVLQLGNGATGPPRIKFRPRPLAVTYNGVSSGYAVTPEPTWLSTDYPAMPHYAMKCVYDNQSGTSVAQIGYVSFYFRYTFEMCDPD
jgi:hypothetical protein